jgi:excisionase family DNA binding protein
MPISEAAKVLELSSARVRAMAVHGQLPATKVGDRWLVERAAVERRRREGSHDGRRFSPQNAWALMLLASGEDVEGVNPSVRSRLKRAMALEGLEGLGPRLGPRAEVLSFRAHPGEIPHLLQDPQLVRSGISAAAAKEFGLVSGREADGYLQKSALRKFVAKHALEPAELDGNVRLRLVSKEAWRFLQGRRFAPRAAVALDLAEEPDSRSAKAGQRVLRAIDDRYRRQALQKRSKSLQSLN